MLSKRPKPNMGQEHLSTKKSEPSTRLEASEISQRNQYKRTKSNLGNSDSAQDAHIFNIGQLLATKFGVSYFKNRDRDKIKMFFFSDGSQPNIARKVESVKKTESQSLGRSEQSQEFLYLSVYPRENRIEVVDCNAKKEIEKFDRVAVTAGQQVVNIEVQLRALLNHWRGLSQRRE